MNVVEQAARIIDPEAFMEVVYFDNSTGKQYKLSGVELSRKELHKSQAICRAIDVLKLALQAKDLRGSLIQDESKRWRKMGIPQRILDDPQTKKLLAGKFA